MEAAEDSSASEREKVLEDLIDRLSSSAEHEAVAQEIGGAPEMITFTSQRPTPVSIQHFGQYMLKRTGRLSGHKMVIPLVAFSYDMKFT